MTGVQSFMEDKNIAEIPAGKITPHDPVFVNTRWGAVAVYGHELVSKKDLLIVGECLNLPEFQPENDPDSNLTDHCVRSIIFREDRMSCGRGVGANPLGLACPMTYSIGISLEEIFREAEEDTRKNDYVAMQASFHRLFLITILHEINHLAIIKELPAPGTPEWDRLEDEAETWSRDTSFWLAKNVDIEPAYYAECPFFSWRMAGLLNGKEDEWSLKQKEMLDNHTFYDFPGDEKHKRHLFHKFKAYMQLASDDCEDFEEWGKPSISNATGVSPIQEAIAAVSEPDKPAIEHPTSGMPNLFHQEYMDMFEDATYSDPVGATFPAAANPNVPLFGGVPATPSPAFSGFPVSTPTVTQPQAPAFNGFPVANQQMAPAPQMAPVLATLPPVQVFQTTGLTDQQTTEIVTGVYMKCYNHIFTHCGRLLNSDKAFENPAAVHNIGVPLSEMEMKVIVKMECVDANGKWHPNVPTSGGMLYGGVFKNTQLPYYKLTINHGGFERVRLLMPQNPAKTGSNGALSKPALEARAGSCIMYIKEGDDNVIRAGGKTWLFKIINGQLQMG